MTIENFTLVLAVLLPAVISFIKQAHFAQTVNAVIAIAVYVVAGVAFVVLQGQALDLNNIVPSVGVFTVGGTVAYQLFWKNIESTTAAAKK